MTDMPEQISKFEPFYKFTLSEVRAIYRIIEREWVNRDDNEAMKVSDRISDIVRKDELDRRNSESTCRIGEST